MTHAKGHDAAGRRADPERWAELDAQAKAGAAGPAVGGDLGALAAQLGINFSGLSPAGEARDPFFGQPSTDYPVLVKKGKKLLATKSFAEWQGGGRRTALQSSLLKDLFRKPPAEVAGLQQRLFAGGFYSGDVDEDDLALGTPDEDTIKAYERALARAAAYNEADEDVTLDEVIDRAVATRAGKEKKSGKDPLVIELSHPDDVRKGVEAVARKAIGRKLSDSEREQFVGLWHAIQSGAQRSAYNMAETGGSVTAPPRFEVFADTEIRRRYGAEAGAHDVALQGNEFFDLLKEVGG